MREHEAFLMSERDSYRTDASPLPGLGEEAVPEAEESCEKDLGETGRVSLCDSCPKMQEYYDVGPCPVCESPGMKMKVQTHTASCSFCGREYYIPLAIQGLCYNNVLWEQYEVRAETQPDRKSLLAAAKILEVNSVSVYSSIKSGRPLKTGLSYDQALKLKAMGLDIVFVPQLKEYEKYKECWGDSLILKCRDDRRCIHER